MNYFKGKRILITGAGGFIASHLCRNLFREGADIYILVKYNSVIDHTRLVDIWNHITPIEADIRNADSLKQLNAFKPEIIYHFAAYNHVGDSFTHISEAIDVNGKGTLNLLESYENYKRFIYISSSEIYGHQSHVPFKEDALPFPISPYAIGKYSGELYARMKWHVFKKPITILRPFNAFGPYQSAIAIIPELIIKCLKGEDINTTPGQQTRNFNYIDNLIEGFKLATINEESIGEIINLGTDHEISIADLAHSIHKLSRSKSKLNIGKLSYRPTEIWRMAADSHKAHSLLGWKSQVSLEKGLVTTIEWYKKYLNVFNNPTSSLLTLCQIQTPKNS